MKTPQDAYEGSEKKLEVILSDPQMDLRKIPQAQWDAVVQAGGARILNKISTDRLDSYLLSESSLFVWRDRMLMITCGQTAPIRALPMIMDVVGAEAVGFLFYERKNLLFPNAQPSDFEDESAEISKYFPGKSYRLGPANSDHIHIFYASKDNNIVPANEVTLQILMRGLHVSKLQQLAHSKQLTSDLILNKPGIGPIHHPMTYDIHLFNPSGFSINAINAGTYYTIHVTPQPVGSYASFETNLPIGDYKEIIKRLVAIFKPLAFSIVLSHHQPAKPTDFVADVNTRPTGRHLEAPYNIIEKSYYEFDCGYSISYFNYETDAF